MRKSLFAIVILGLIGVAYVAGRMSAPAPNYAVGEIAGDLSLEQAWAEFLQSQQSTLELFRSSQFFEDDQERAEAYRSVLYGIVAAIQSGEAEEEPRPLSPGLMAKDLQAAAASLFDRSASWLQAAEHTWNLVPRNDISMAAPGQDQPPGQYSAMGSWQLDNEQAIILSVVEGDERYQGVDLDKLWYANPEYQTRISSLSREQMDCAADGRCYAVISHRDPGVRNWLDTGGQRRGLIVMRWQGLDSELPETQQPRARLVNFEKLSQQLPAEPTPPQS